jgi:alanine racemase
MRSLVRALRERRSRYETLVEVCISAASLVRNLRTFEALRPGVSVAPVLKSNAYGHGLVEAGKIFADQSVLFMCVDSYFEAVILRNEKIRTPLLVIGYTPLRNMVGKLSNVAFGVFSLEELQRVAKNARVPVTIHLEIDTGMRRHGILPSEIDEALLLVKSNPRISLDGVFTHFADADTRGSVHAQAQVKTWNALVPEMRKQAPEVKYFHCGGTQAVSYIDELDLNCLRIGIGLYGFNTSLKPLVLEPALEMRSRITSLRTLKQGEKIGYNGTFTASRDMRVASVSVGYFEGVERELSNKGFFLVHGAACPIIGRVSMNMTSIDVSNVPEVAIDDEVIVISKDPAALNSLAHIATLTGVLAYELRVHIPGHLRRVVI